MTMNVRAYGNFGDMNHELNGDIYVIFMDFLVILVGYLLTKAKDCDLSKTNRGTYDLTNKKGDLSNT